MATSKARAHAAASPTCCLAGTGKRGPLVCPLPPGSTSDLLPRALAPLMSQSMGVPVIVENRPGATGSIGAAFVAKAEPSGHTLLIAPTPVLAVNQWLYKELPYNPEKDLVPIINAATTPNLWVAHPS